MLYLFPLAIRNISRRKKRAALTIIGIFIGIAAVVALLSIGQGLEQSINAQFEKVGADKIIIQAKEVGFGGQFTPGQLKQHELELIKDVHGVLEAGGVIFRAAQVQFNNLQRTQYIMSNPKKAKEVDLSNAVHTLEVETGRLLSHKDKQKAVIGYDLARKKTFQRDMIVGNKPVINNETFEIVGILKRIGDPVMDTIIVLPEDDVRRILKEPEAFSMLFAQSEKGTNPEIVAQRIDGEIRRDRHQKAGKEDFNVQTSTELIKSFNTVLNIIQFVFIGIASISLIVGGIGIMNTMYTSVLERTKEIGVMKAVGAKNNDVMLLFLIESGFFGFFGGLLGIIAGMGIAKTVEVAAVSMFGPGTITIAFSSTIIIGSLLFAFLIGSISGIAPALRAAKLKPVDALRYE